MSKIVDWMEYAENHSKSCCSNIPLIKYEKLDEDVLDPMFATDGSACFDIAANCDGVIKPGETVLVGSGLKFEIPEGYFISVRPRSGISFKTDIWLKNSPGTIDTDYTGEVKLILHNGGEGGFWYKRGDRLAQCLVEKMVRAKFVEGKVEDSKTRGAKGFGSSGVSKVK